VSSGVAPLTRGQLALGAGERLKRGHGFKPDVLLVTGPGGRVIVKDYAGRGAWVRTWLAPWLVRRELRVFRSLETVEAVPRSLGAIDSLALALEFRPGEPLSRALAARMGGEAVARFLADLERDISAMHERGVVHLDLRHRDNVLWGADARPVLVDFAGAMSFRPGSFWYRWYRPTVLVYDERALAKWRERLRPGAPASPRTLRRRLRAWVRRRANSLSSRSPDRTG